MDLIILNDGLYQLIPVTKQIMEGIVITAEINCFDLCDILRIKGVQILPMAFPCTLAIMGKT